MYCIHGKDKFSCVNCAIENQTREIIQAMERLTEPKPSLWRRIKRWRIIRKAK